jgi:hypothetical protein
MVQRDGELIVARSSSARDVSLLAQIVQCSPPDRTSIIHGAVLRTGTNDIRPPEEFDSPGGSGTRNSTAEPLRTNRIELAL